MSKNKLVLTCKNAVTKAYYGSCSLRVLVSCDNDNDDADDDDDDDDDDNDHDNDNE